MKAEPLNLPQAVIELMARLLAAQQAEEIDEQDFGSACVHAFLTLLAIDYSNGEMTREGCYEFLANLPLRASFDSIADNLQRISHDA